MRLKLNKLLLAAFLMTIGISGLHAQGPKKVINNFSLNGKITGRDTGSVYLYYEDKNGGRVIDSANIKNGLFSFNGTIDKPVFVALTGHKMRSMNDRDPNFVQLFLEPGKMTIALTSNDFKHSKITGSVTQKDREMLEQQIKNRPFSRILDSLNNEIAKFAGLYHKGDTSSVLTQKWDAAGHQVIRYRDFVKRMEYAFAVKHPKSDLSPFLVIPYLAQQRLSVDSAEMFYKGFVPAVQQSKYGKDLKAWINEKRSAAVGTTAYPFVKKDINGKDLGLASFKGKNYVLLDFWASWCVPCRQFTPKIKEVYQKYHDKGLEIISISWDNNEDSWKKAVADDGTDIWHNVIASENGPNDNSMSQKYSIPYIPTLILIDKNGTIIGRYDNGDKGAALNRKMEELFNKS